MKTLKTALFYFVQFTWGLLPNIAGFLYYLVLRRKYETGRYRHAFVVYIPKENFGGMSMGVFILIGTKLQPDVYHDILIHEYGHTIQVLILGPLAAILSGLPSSLWGNFPPLVRYRKKRNISYYWLFCEGWANLWGIWWTKEKFQSKLFLETGRFGKPM